MGNHGSMTICDVVNAIRPGEWSSYEAVAQAAGLVNGQRRVASHVRDATCCPTWRVLGKDGRPKEQARVVSEPGVSVEAKLESEGLVFVGGRAPSDRAVGAGELRARL